MALFDVTVSWFLPAPKFRLAIATELQIQMRGRRIGAE